MSSDALVTIAEVSAAFVGFSMVVSVLRPASTEEQIRALAIRDVAEIGLIVLAGALAPLAVGLFPIAEPSMWRACSFGLSLAMLACFSFSQVRFRRLGLTLRGSANVALAVVFIGLTVAGNLLLWWNIISPSGAINARYVVALLFFLAIAGGLFVEATFGSRNYGGAV